MMRVQVEDVFQWMPMFDIPWPFGKHARQIRVTIEEL
jgi:hypothetical protein